MSFISIEIVYKNMFYKKVIKVFLIKMHIFYLNWNGLQNDVKKLWFIKKKKSFWLKCISFIQIEIVYNMLKKLAFLTNFEKSHFLPIQSPMKNQ